MGALMPRPVGYGRPGTKVVPDDWQATHAAVVDKTLDCTVTIGPAGVTPVWNEERGQTESQPSVAYSGAAAISPAAQNTGGQTVAAQDVVPTRDYEVKLTAAVATVEVGHIVTVDTCPKDAALVGSRLLVVAVGLGSRRFSRVLRAVLAD